jgi:hypothetical protein
MHRVGAALGTPAVQCRYAPGYGLRREYYWSSPVGSGVGLTVRLPWSGDTAEPAWDADPVGSGSVVFGINRYGEEGRVECP